MQKNARTHARTHTHTHTHTHTNTNARTCARAHAHAHTHTHTHTLTGSSTVTHWCGWMGRKRGAPPGPPSRWDSTVVRVVSHSSSAATAACPSRAAKCRLERPSSVRTSRFCAPQQNRLQRSRNATTCADAKRLCHWWSGAGAGAGAGAGWAPLDGTHRSRRATAGSRRAPPSPRGASAPRLRAAARVSASAGAREGGESSCPPQNDMRASTARRPFRAALPRRGPRRRGPDRARRGETGPRPRR